MQHVGRFAQDARHDGAKAPQRQRREAERELDGEIGSRVERVKRDDQRNGHEAQGEQEVPRRAHDADEDEEHHRGKHARVPVRPRERTRAAVRGDDELHDHHREQESETAHRRPDAHIRGTDPLLRGRQFDDVAPAGRKHEAERRRDGQRHRRPQQKRVRPHRLRESGQGTAPQDDRDAAACLRGTGKAGDRRAPHVP